MFASFRCPETRDHSTLLLPLCGGPVARPPSMHNLFEGVGIGCRNYGTANGPHCDLANNMTFAAIERDTRAGEYVACTASPECGSFSKLHNLPGPRPLRAVSGPDRYGFQTNSPADKERVRIHNLVSIRVAKILSITPWIFEAPACFDNQVSVLHFDEYIQLLAKLGIHHRKGIQCPFGPSLTNSPHGFISWLT